MTPYTFTDRLGRSWDVTMTMAAAKRIDSSDFSLLTQEKFSILQPDKRLFANILQGTGLMMAMVWAVVRPQAITKHKEGGFTEDPADPAKAELAELEFMEGFDGEALQKCREVFWKALADFFPDHRTVLLALIERYNRTQTKVTEEIRKLEPEMDSMINAQIEAATKNLRKELENLKTQELNLGEDSGK